jgi:putative flippase GtrA
MTNFLQRLYGFIKTIDIKNYVNKQIRYSIGNTPSIPLGLLTLYGLTQWAGLWYIYSSLVGWVVGTTINFNMQILFRVVSFDGRSDYISKIIRFFIGSAPLVPLGTGVLYGLTDYIHIWYVVSSILSMMVTTVSGMAIQIALKVVKIKQREASMT